MQRKILSTVLKIAVVLVMLCVATAGWLGRPFFFGKQMVYGVTFSVSAAEWVANDWRDVYEEILVDLKVKHLRLSAYWNVIEPRDGQYDFSELDYQMDRAAAEGAHVILSVGRKLPRWPECHVPKWASDWPEEQQQARVIEMLAVVIKRYQNHAALEMWQLENEPLLSFGNCPPADQQFLAREEQLIRSLDEVHPIMITDSGELNWWLEAAQYGDVLGTTMYRTVHSQRTDQPFSYDYIFPAWLYRAKARMVTLVTGNSIIISELQGEPWGTKPYTEMSEQEKYQSFSPARFKELKRFAERTQLNEAYWWGVEYWYWEKEENHNSAYWDFAKSMF